MAPQSLHLLFLLSPPLPLHAYSEVPDPISEEGACPGPTTLYARCLRPTYRSGNLTAPWIHRHMQTANEPSTHQADAGSNCSREVHGGHRQQPKNQGIMQQGVAPISPALYISQAASMLQLHLHIPTSIRLLPAGQGDSPQLQASGQGDSPQLQASRQGDSPQLQASCHNVMHLL